MNSKAKATVILESRKIVKSYLGIFITCLHTFIFAVSFGFSIVFNTSGYQGLDLAEESICWAIGLVPRVVKTRDSDYGSVAYVLYLMACLLQMYIPLRALIQPSFLAGKPDINVRKQKWYFHILYFLPFIFLVILAFGCSFDIEIRYRNNLLHNARLQHPNPRHLNDPHQRRLQLRYLPNLQRRRW